VPAFLDHAGKSHVGVAIELHDTGLRVALRQGLPAGSAVTARLQLDGELVTMPGLVTLQQHPDNAFFQGALCELDVELTGTPDPRYLDYVARGPE
jgi:hypothetical protein